MKTLILNGSPRPRGDTAALIGHFVRVFPGEHWIVNAYASDIAPCVDCRRCRTQSGCAIEDDMGQIYDYIRECDNILIASPVYFEALTGRLLDVGSRLQTYYSARVFRGEDPFLRPKRGAALLVGGSGGGMEPALRTARILLRLMNCAEICAPICVRDTDRRPAIEDAAALRLLEDVASLFGEERV